MWFWSCGWCLVVSVGKVVRPKHIKEVKIDYKNFLGKWWCSGLWADQPDCFLHHWRLLFCCLLHSWYPILLEKVTMRTATLLFVVDLHTTSAFGEEQQSLLCSWAATILTVHGNECCWAQHMSWKACQFSLLKYLTCRQKCIAAKMTYKLSDSTVFMPSVTYKIWSLVS